MKEHKVTLNRADPFLPVSGYYFNRHMNPGYRSIFCYSQNTHVIKTLFPVAQVMYY